MRKTRPDTSLRRMAASGFLRALLVAAALSAPPSSARSSSPLLYFALGDSTAAGVGAEQGGGYPARIARRLGSSGIAVRLVNLGASGATAQDLRRNQLPRVMAERPALVTIGIGLNDCINGRSLRDFARDLHVVADFISRTKASVVILELPDLSLSPSGEGSPRSLERRIAEFNAAIRQVAERHGFIVGELEARSRVAFKEPAGLFARDGFHPSSRGYELWTDSIWPAIERALAPRVQARRPAPAAEDR